MFRSIAILCALASAGAFKSYSPVVSTKTSLKMSTMEPVAMEEAVVEETEAPTPPPPPGKYKHYHHHCHRQFFF